MEHPFTSLPKEVQIEIFKNLPNFRRVDTYNYKHGKTAFENMYCQLDISKQEFLNYIENDDPDEAIIFARNTENELHIFLFRSQYFEASSVSHFILYINNVDIGEYIIDTSLLVGKLDNNAAVVSYINEFIFNDHSYISHYYDIKSVNSIVAKRHCETKNYTKKYTLDYVYNLVKYKKGGGELTYLVRQVENLVYISLSMDVINNNVITYNNFYGANLEEEVFDTEGNAYDEELYKTRLEHVAYNYNLYYKDFITWLTL
jgi:hypothetical protein